MADGFLTDEQMMALESNSTPSSSFISDADMAKLESKPTPTPQPKKELSFWDKYKYSVMPNFDNTVQGGLGMLSGVTGGFFDEIGAGGNALIDKALGSDKSVSDLYNQYKTGFEAYEDAQPTSGARLVGEFAGGALNPIARLTGANMQGGLLKKALVGALGGATEGALYGAGTSRGGLENRLESAETGAMYGGALGGALPIASGGLNWLKDKAQAGQINALGIGKRDLKRALKGAGKFEQAKTGENPLVSAFKRIDKEGMLDDSLYAEDLIKKVNSSSEKINNELVGVFKNVDEVLEEPVIPEFKNALKHVKNLSSDEIDSATRSLNGKIKKILEKTDGSLSSLQKEKIAYGKKTYSGSSEAYSKGLDRAITRDLKETVENTVKDLAESNKLGNTRSNIVNELNTQLRQNKLLMPVLEDALAEQKSTGIAKLLSMALSTTGLGTGLSLGSAFYNQDPKQAIPALAILAMRNPRIGLTLNKALERNINRVQGTGLGQDQLRRGLISALSGE